MPLTISYTERTKITERCIWIRDGNRHISLSYDYVPPTGYIQYAASIFRSQDNGFDVSRKIINQHNHTTQRRFAIRPVIAIIKTYLSYNDLMKEIRRMMCDPARGCRGPRIKKSKDNRSSISSIESGSSQLYLGNDSQDRVINSSELINLYRKKEYYRGTATSISTKTTGKSIAREIYICFKVNENTGLILYGASIYFNEGKDDSKNDRETHFGTSLSRLEKCPVHMNLNTSMYLDDETYSSILELIYDNIFTRRSGKLQIRGQRIS